jgi:spore germination protein GerM
MPVSTRLLSLKIKDGIAAANFSSNLTRFGGGSATEILLVAAIVNTLTEFPEIKQVQILIEGKKVETLAGHIDISEPLGRSEKIIRRSGN